VRKREREREMDTQRNRGTQNRVETISLEPFKDKRLSIIATWFIVQQLDIAIVDWLYFILSINTV
jgi:hypothetical protein